MPHSERLISSMVPGKQGQGVSREEPKHCPGKATPKEGESVLKAWGKPVDCGGIAGGLRVESVLKAWGKRGENRSGGEMPGGTTRECTWKTSEKGCKIKGNTACVVAGSGGWAR